MAWTKEQTERHRQTAKILDQIKDLAFNFIGHHPNSTELEVHKLIRRQFRKNNLWAPKDSPIVAFRENTSFVHYFGNRQKKLKPDSIILLDLWSRSSQKSSPFADITWMGFYGRKIPSEFYKVFNIVIKSRNACLRYLETQLEKKEMPTGAELDAVARIVIKNAGYGKNFTHSTGHSLGFISPHGMEAGINYRNDEPIQKNLGYTIEPGIYLKNKFGARSEIDFYISNSNKLIVTTSLQENLRLI